MAYTKQNFQDGQILYASGLNKMDDELIRLGTDKVNNDDIINNLTSTDATKPLSAAQGKVLNDGKVNKTDIVNNLTSTDTDKPLSANQGKVLNEGKINISDIINNLTSTDTDKPLSAAQGKELNDTKVNTIDIINNLTSTNTDKPLSAAQGKTLNDNKVNISDIVDNLTSSDVNKPLSANQGKALDEKKINYTDVKDDLTSTDTNKPLSANQGKVLNDIKVNISDVKDNLTSTDTDKPLSANQGAVLNRDVVNNTNAVIESTYKQWNKENPINDCKENLIKGIKLYGKGYQKSYSGKNLIDQNKIVIGDMVGGTVAEGNNYVTDYISVSEGENYVLSGNCEKLVHENAWFDENKTYITRSFDSNITVPSGARFVRIEFDKTVELNQVKMQLEKGSVATDYEPYVGGIPSPNPQYPQEIQSVVNPKLTVCGKNLFDIDNPIYCANSKDNLDYKPKIENGLIYSGGKTGVVTGSALAIKVEKDKTYTISMNISGENANVLFRLFDNVGISDFVDLLIYDKLTGDKQFTVSISKDGYLGINIYSDNFYGAIIKNLQIELGSTATEYEPYKEQSVTLPYTLNAIPVSSGGNVTIDGQQYIADYVDIEKKQLVRNVGEVDLGTLAWTYNSGLFEKTYTNVISNCTCALLEKYIVKNSYSEFSANDYVIAVRPLDWSNYYVNKLIVKDTSLSSTDKPSGMFYYQLATPTITDLTDEEVQAFKDLHTYYPTTNIINSSDVLSGACDLKYLSTTSLTTLDINKLSIFDTAGFHNSIVRGKDITSYYTDGTLWDRIAGINGFRPYEDLYLGDYFKMSRAISAYEQTQQYQTTGSQYVTIAGFDCMRKNGDSDSMNFNHITCVPGQFRSGAFHFGRSRMNPTHTTVGGYVGSEMYTTIIGEVATEGSTETTATINQQLYAEFGSHLKTSRELLSNAINASGYNRFGTNSGCSNNWGWYSCQAVLMSEVEVYGATVWSSSGFDTGTACMQLPLFAKDKACINNRSAYYWLKDVAAASVFCDVDYYGRADFINAGSSLIYVRPRFNLA